MTEKMKWGSICTTLHQDDGGTASLSLLHQCLGYTELGQQRLEVGFKGPSRKDKRIPQIKEPQLHTFKEADVATTEWDNLPAWLSLFASHPRET